MSDSPDNEQQKTQQKITEHLSNERTLLAWIRTSIGIMAFGFVVVEFSLFTKDLNLALEVELKGNHFGYSSPVGMLIVSTCAMTLLFALIRYHRTKKDINTGQFRNGVALLNALVIVIFLVSFLLLGYLFMAAW